MIESNEAFAAQACAVARELGYSTPSAFIAMFQRLTGESPDSARKRSAAAPA